MIPKFIKNNLRKDDKKIFRLEKANFKVPLYNPKNHYLELTKSSYFHALIIIRHYIKIISDYYFSSEIGAKNIDLFMLTPSVSSPMGPGSDSDPIKIQFGKLETFLVDSSQFGFEPLLLNGFEKVYCYLPSMRGENPGPRHLNQFFHCELEIVGTLSELIPIVEGYIKILCDGLLLMDNIIDKISDNSQRTKDILKKTVEIKNFPKLNFDEAVEILVKNGKRKYVNITDHGRDITSKGEIELLKILKIETPIWLTYFDRDRVPFYQKPDSKNPKKTINADLLFPPIIENAFGGEIVGSGQRQDNEKEMYESLKRQKNISPKPYEWYIDLRRQPNYKVTSGFGLGIERFIAWSLGKDNIRDVILYPRIKDVITLP